MKNFKNIYKLLLVLPLIFMVSCDDSDDIVEVLTISSTTLENSVFIETDDTHETIRDVGRLAEVELEAGVNNASENQDVTVSFNVLKDGSSAVLGVDYTLDDVVISMNSNFGSSNIVFLTCGEFEVSISSVSDSSLVIAGNRLFFNIIDTVLNFTIEWADPFYDYDIYLVSGNQDFGGDVIDSSLGVTNFESIMVAPPVGFSTIFLDDWWGDNASIPVTLTVQGCEAQIYNVIMDMDKWVLLIETTLDENDNPVYTFTDLN